MTRQWLARSATPRGGVAVLPATRLGRWSVLLGASCLVLVLSPFPVVRLGLACGLVGGVTALLAIARDRERAVTVFAALGPLLVLLAFVLAEFVGH